MVVIVVEVVVAVVVGVVVMAVTMMVVVVMVVRVAMDEQMAISEWPAQGCLPLTPSPVAKICQVVTSWELPRVLLLIPLREFTGNSVQFCRTSLIHVAHCHDICYIQAVKRC